MIAHHINKNLTIYNNSPARAFFFKIKKKKLIEYWHSFIYKGRYIYKTGFLPRGWKIRTNRYSLFYSSDHQFFFNHSNRKTYFWEGGSRMVPYYSDSAIERRHQNSCLKKENNVCKYDALNWGNKRLETYEKRKTSTPQNWQNPESILKVTILFVTMVVGLW